LEDALPSTDKKDVEFVRRVEQQVPVIQSQLDRLFGQDGTAASHNDAVEEKDEKDEDEENTLTSKFLSLTLDPIVDTTPHYEAITRAKSDERRDDEQSKKSAESKQSGDGEEEDNFCMSLLPCLLDYFQQHPNQFPVTTQHNARTFVRHVLKQGKYGITQARLARVISKCSDAAVSRWLSGRKGQEDHTGEKVIDWINGSFGCLASSKSSKLLICPPAARKKNLFVVKFLARFRRHVYCVLKSTVQCKIGWIKIQTCLLLKSE